MHPNAQLIQQFYEGFKQSDSAAMIACYHPEVEFSDPVFPRLKGGRAMAMWGMWSRKRADPKSGWFENIQADDQSGSAHGEANYNSPANGRPIQKKIEAKRKSTRLNSSHMS